MTFVPFTPSPIASPPFSATITLDSQTYLLSTAWNLYRGDWYMSLSDQQGNLVIAQPLIGSPPEADVYLAPGLFATSTLVYRVGTGTFEVGP